MKLVMSFAILVVGVVALLFFIGALSSGFGSNNAAMKRDQDGIELCDSKYEDMRAQAWMTPDALKLAHDTCEFMRDKYRKKWGKEP